MPVAGESNADRATQACCPLWPVSRAAPLGAWPVGAGGACLLAGKMSIMYSMTGVWAEQDGVRWLA